MNKELEKIIRRINRVLESYVKTFGTDFSLYGDILNSLKMNEIATRISSKGIIQIQRGKVNANLNSWQIRELKELAKFPTAYELYKKTKDDMKNKKDDEPDPIEDQVEDKTDPDKEPPKEKDEFDGLDPVIVEIMKKDYVKKNKDIFTYLSDQIKANAKLSKAERDLYNRAAGRSDEMSYDELYTLIYTAKRKK